MQSNKLTLVKPAPEYIDGYLAASYEFKEAGLHLESFQDPDYFHIWKHAIFEKFEDHSRGINLPPGYVPATTWWLVYNDEFIGEGSIRHRLTPSLWRFGGHIGYAIRKSKWNMGYGTHQLSLLLKKAATLGIARTLITCDETNTASARVIEKNGGTHMDTVQNIIGGKTRATKRYIVPTV